MKTKGAVLDYVILAVCGSLASASKDIWSTQPYEKILYPPLASVIAYLLLNFLFNNIPFLRGRQRRYEGYWVECVQKDTNVYYSLFPFCEMSNVWRLRGGQTPFMGGRR